MNTILEKLIAGNKKFQEQYYQTASSIYENLKKGQSPEVMVIACSDSRVDPAIIMGADPGDLFVVRNVANVVPPYQNDDGYHGTSAALEFAVTALKVKHIIILGHTQCGGITALVESHASKRKPSSTQNDFLCNLNKKGHFISKWMSIVESVCECIHQETNEEATELTLTQKADRCSQEAILLSRENLRSFPFVQEKIQAEQLALHAWYFDLADGEIKVIHKTTN
jgi:carbonic anhydrase